jgi:hypothetical protein
MESLITLAGILVAVATVIGGGFAFRSIQRARAERDRILRGLEAQLGEVLRTARRTEVAHANVDHKLAVVHGEIGASAISLHDLRADHLRRQDFEESMTAIGGALRELLTRTARTEPQQSAHKRKTGRPE